MFLMLPSLSDLQHNLWLLTFRGELGLSPKLQEGAKRVLDAGTGTGVWAVEYGMETNQNQVESVQAMIFLVLTLPVF